MAPATSDLLAGIPLSHLPGLAGAAAGPLVGRLRGRRDALTALLLVTAGLHLGLAAGHATVAPALALLFLLDGIAFLALLALRRDRWGWRLATGVLLAGTVAAYLVVVGAGRETADPVGVLDKSIELVALGLLMLPHARSARGWRRTLRLVVASGATLTVTFAATAGIWALDLAGSGHAHGANAACAPNHRPGPGTVLRPVPCGVTPEQQATADRLVAETRAGIAPYQDARVALAAGYRPTTPDADGAVHYVSWRASAGPLDPGHPAALVYASTRHGPVLLGAMYQMPRQGEAGPDVGGALTPWHYHTNVCLSLPGLFVAGLSTPFGQCPPGSVRVTSADQLHVWTAANPNGPFGDLDGAWVRRLARS